MSTPRLSELTTMHIGGPVEEFAIATSRDDIERLVKDAKKRKKAFFMIGGGSNIIATDKGYKGLVIKDEIPGFEILTDDKHHAVLKIGAGENWDKTVEKTVKMGLSGIEAMSAIPGTVGATPVQNVGAYGQEIADTLLELEAYNTDTLEWEIIPASECEFGYRTSKFKNPEHRHHIITSVTLKLSKSEMKPPFYAALNQYLEHHNIHSHSPAAIREAVIAIRKIKLPDPTKIPNAGSFFKNPIVSQEKAQSLLEQYPHMPTFPMDDGRVKLAAGWMIEQAGLKGYRSHLIETYSHNALVAINLYTTSYIDLAGFRKDIKFKIAKKFGVELEQEPELLFSPE